MDPDRTPEQRKEHNKLLEEMRARRNNGEQVFLAQGKIKVRRQYFAREDNGAANVTSKVKDNGSNKVSENHKEDVAQKSGADAKHETNQLDDQQAEDKQPVADAQQQTVVLDNNTLHPQEYDNQMKETLGKTRTPEVFRSKSQSYTPTVILS